MYAQAAMAGIQLASGYFASQNVKATAELNRDIADMNAEFAELDAYDSEIEGISAQARYQSMIDNTLAEQSAIMAAQDIDISYGSAASIPEETKFNGQLNMMEISKQAQEQALGFTRQARDIRTSGNMAYADAQGKAGQIMGNAVLGAAKTGLSGYKPSAGSSVDRAGGTTQASRDYLSGNTGGF